MRILVDRHWTSGGADLRRRYLRVFSNARSATLRSRCVGHNPGSHAESATDTAAARMGLDGTLVLSMKASNPEALAKFAKTWHESGSAP